MDTKHSVYYKLFDELEKIEKIANVCNIQMIDGKYTCNGEFNIPCCHPACPQLGDNGCKVKNIGCKLFLCGNAIKKLKEYDTDLFDQWIELTGIVGKLRIKQLKYRPDEEVISEMEDKNISKLLYQKNYLDRLFE